MSIIIRGVLHQQFLGRMNAGRGFQTAQGQGFLVDRSICAGYSEWLCLWNKEKKRNPDNPLLRLICDTP
jgi:hypothetical protein